jgi:hypothetical protein
MAAEMMFGARVERRAATAADRPLSAMVAEHVMPAAVEMDQVSEAEAAAPVGAVEGLGYLVAQHAEVVLGGQEG